MRLYQWMPYATFKKTIGDGCIWVRATMPMEFNDPFDCTGGIWGYPNSDVVREFMEKCPASRMCFEQRFQLGMLGDDYNTAAVREVATLLWNMFRDRRFIGQGFRIACFSRADEMNAGEQLLMWSHYGEKGLGVRLGVEVDGRMENLVNVEYEEMAPKLDLSELSALNELESFIATCIKTKHRAWKYEHETRIVFKGPRHPDICKYEDSETKITCERWRIPLKQVTEVAIGGLRLNARGYPDEEMSLLRKLKDAGCRPEAFKCARLNYNTYSYESMASFICS